MHADTERNLGVECESMIDSSRQCDEIAFDHFNANPLIIGVPHIKVATPIHNETHLLISM